MLSIISFRITLTIHSLSLSLFTFSHFLHSRSFSRISYLQLNRVTVYTFSTLYFNDNTQLQIILPQTVEEAMNKKERQRNREKKKTEKHWKKADFFIFSIYGFIFVNVVTRLMKHINFVDAMTRDSFCSRSQLQSM